MSTFLISDIYILYVGMKIYSELQSKNWVWLYSEKFIHFEQYKKKASRDINGEFVPRYNTDSYARGCVFDEIVKIKAAEINHLELS